MHRRRSIGKTRRDRFSVVFEQSFRRQADPAKSPDRESRRKPHAQRRRCQRVQRRRRRTAWDSGAAGYFEATFSFDPQSVVANPHNSWPAWWAMSLEHFLNLPGQHWTGQLSNVMHFAEMDFFIDTWNWAGRNTYGGATHDWGGTWGTNASKKGWQYNYHNNNFVIRLPKDTDFTKPHRYGYLWLPASATSQGYAHYYFDGLPTTNKVTWSFLQPRESAPTAGGHYAGGSLASTTASTSRWYGARV